MKKPNQPWSKVKPFTSKKATDFSPYRCNEIVENLEISPNDE